MLDKDEFNRQVRRTAFLTVGLAAALVFGIITLVSGDWLPGAVIVVATLVGLVRQVPVIRRLCSEGPSPSPPGQKPAH
jgi:predicted tellurium resistance membrane protein TerC